MEVTEAELAVLVEILGDRFGLGAELEDLAAQHVLDDDEIALLERLGVVRLSWR